MDNASAPSVEVRTPRDARRTKPHAGLALLSTWSALTAGWLAGAAGCAAPGAVQPAPTAASETKAWSADLDRLALRQIRRPDTRASAAQPPAGLAEELGAPLEGEALERASAPLADVLERFRAVPLPSAASLPTGPVSEQAQLEATRLYVSGRSRRLDGDLAGAEQDLRQSARLDPRPAAVWREYAQAQAALGNQPLAASAFRRAIERDPGDVRSLEELSRSALERRDSEGAAALLARLATLNPREFDPALTAILSARLGRALLELGYLSAGAEALREALNLPEQFDSVTNYIPELTLVYRQRGDLWREIGDGSMRRGELDHAAEAYRKAASLPSLDSGATSARRVYAAMRLGQSAAAARLTLSEIEAADGRIDERRLELLRSIASGSSIAREMARAITALGSTLPDSTRRLAAGPLARAAAAVLPDDEARALLRQRLAQAPADEATLRDLLARAPGADSTARIREAIALANTAPLHEARYAQALVVASVNIAPLLDAWPSLTPDKASSLGGRLLHARLLSLSGDLAEAEAELATLVVSNPNQAAAVVAQTSALNRLGRFEEAQTLLASLEGSPDEGVRLARAIAQAEMGDTEGALRSLTALIPTAAAGADPDILLITARLAVAVGRAEKAEQWLRAALEIDPARDEAYAGLLALYAPAGPLANETKLLETARAMRDADPRSPTLRVLRAQEAAARRQFDVAERELQALIEEYPQRPEALRTLIQVWKATGALDRGEKWLRDQIERRPGLAPLTLALADTLAASDRKREAIALLEAWLARAPGDDDASRALESALRQVPGEEKRADAMAEARLARAPASADTFLELIEMALRRGDPRKSLEWLDSLAALDRPFTPAQLQKSERIAQTIAEFALLGKLDGEQALTLFQSLAKPIEKPQLQTLFAHIRLLILTSAPAGRIIDAADTCAAAFPAEREGIYTSAVNDLLSDGAKETGRKARPRDALAMIEHASRVIDPPPVRLLTQWILRVAPIFAAPIDLTQEERIASVRSAVERGDKGGVLRDLVSEIARSLSRDGNPLQPPEAAQILAAQMDNADDGPLAERLLRIALAFDPNHVWANNNLGYRLLNEGRDIDEAHAMIERGYNSMKNDPAIAERSSVTDSLGWARYKLGIIRDEPPADGKPGREGAVTLLSRALEMSRRERGQQLSIPIIADHLGDALWATGQREQALLNWIEAASKAQAAMSDPQITGLDSAAQREVRATAESALTKAQAAREDHEPAVSAMIRPSNASNSAAAPPTPAPAPPPVIAPTPPASID